MGVDWPGPISRKIMQPKYESFLQTNQTDLPAVRPPLSLQFIRILSYSFLMTKSLLSNSERN